MFTETLEQKRKRIAELEKKHKGLNYEELWDELKSELIRAKDENEQLGETETATIMNATLSWMKYLENKQKMNTK